jgi:iron complex outermembrane recepter protein
MALRTTKLRDAIAFALAISATTLAGTGSALAQQSDPEESASQLDTIVVTGTRIKSQTMTASSPVTEINAEEFRFSGATVAEDLVNQYPQLSPVFDNLQNNPSLGYSEVDLRGMGAQRTLTLINGRRIPKGLGETPDISIVPPALVRRVDILTGGASAVYGSDAIAGVVNFVLDDQFEGISVNLGYSAFQHKNRNSYMQGLMDDAGFDYPTGNSGLDGVSKNVDIAIGGRFGDGGHAVAWATWRKNDPLFQGERDYSSCALNAAGTACGGSPTSDPANFYIYAFNPAGDLTFAGYAAPVGGVWSEDNYTLYNYAPINYYQRPDSRITAGTSIKYEINDNFKPYIDAMFLNRRAPVQIAASGAFFTDVEVDCGYAPLGSLCSDLGIAADSDLAILVAKRNVEGGPRYYDQEFTNYSLTTGVGGALTDNWSYDASFTYGRSTASFQGYNDFLTSRIRDALLGCPAGSFAGCLPYDVWNDSVTSEQAEALQGVSMQDWVTSLKVFTAYVTGDLGFGLPWANGKNIDLVGGYEWRSERFSYKADTNFASGNFAGSGSENPQIDNGYSVRELFAEANVPLVADAGALNSMDMQLGYRYSDYDTSGGVNTYKVGLGASFLDNSFLVRAGYNRAIRGANVNELFAPQAIALWAGEDPCAGPTPTFTQAQCALTGVTAARYGSVPDNPAGQYNGIFGGNPTVEPEEADTWTIGFAASPIDNLDLSIDYYDLKLSKQIGTLDPSVIIDICANTGDAEFCGLINRNPATGDLFRTNDGYVTSVTNNFGNIRIRGIDLNAAYSMPVGPGRLMTNFVGNYQLERKYEPVPGDDTQAYDCVGVLSAACQQAKWRHIANVRYSFDRFTAGVRWRYMGSVDYSGTTDTLLAARGGIGSFNYIDLSGSVDFGTIATWTIGVNNIADKEPPLVGGSLVLNGNSIGGYDQAGRFIFTSVNFKF